MQVRPLQPARVKAAILLAAMSALAIFFAPCTDGFSVTSAAAGASLSPTSLSFGNQAVSTASAAHTVTLSNTGNAALSITSLAITGTNANNFAQSNNCGSSVAAGASCTISVTFKPTATGTRTGTLSISDNAATASQTVRLTGTGTAPAASVYPTSFSFGSLSVGATSGAQTATLRSTGVGALNVTQVAITGADAGDFAQTNTCGSSLASGAACTIRITFKPKAGGSRTAALSIIDNAKTSPQTVVLTGTSAGSAGSPSGSGTSPAASLSPTSLAFASQSVGTASAAQTVTLKNTGSAALAISSLAITGANAGDFAQTNTCGSSVAAGGSCTISVTFKPAASGSRAASVSITDNATGSPQTIGLSGTGTVQAVSLSASSVSFGNQPIGTTSPAQTVTLNNSGNVALSITSVAITGTNASDFAQTHTCGASVGAGGNCTISITFKPSLASAETASVSIADSATGSPQAASLSGTGTAPAVSLSSTSLSFGSQPIATGSSAQTVTLSNTGNGALSISSPKITGANASDFAEVANTCGSSVAAGGNCTISVTFTPSLASAETASVAISDDAVGSPQAVSLSGTGSADVILSWAASPSSGVVGYDVYRGTASGGESTTPLNSTPIDGTTFVDVNVTAGTAFYYVVTAVGSGGMQSAPSNETEATVPKS